MPLFREKSSSKRKMKFQKLISIIAGMKKGKFIQNGKADEKFSR